MKKSELKQLIREEIKKINESTIIHKTGTGLERELDLDLTQFDNFLLSLQPLIDRKYSVTPEIRKDIISYIVNHLGGYGTLGGGTVNVK